jgi:hypothetical protein
MTFSDLCALLRIKISNGIQSEPMNGAKLESGLFVGQNRDPSRRGMPFIVGILLMLALVWPLFVGMHFVPLTRYPFASRIMLEASGQQPVWDVGYLTRFTELPWMQEAEFGAVSFTYAQDKFAADQYHRGVIPLWDPYTGCGLPTFDEGQFRPFNPLRALFFLWPKEWLYCIAPLLSLLIGAYGGYLWFRKERYSMQAAILGAGLFALNPWFQERLALLDAPSMFLLPWALLGFSQARPWNWKSLALASLPFVVMAHVSHPEAALIVASVAAAYFLGSMDSQKEGPLVHFKSRVAIIAAAGILSAAATTVLWMPVIKAMLFSFSYKSISGWHYIYPYSWLSLLAPAADCFLPAGIAAVLVVGGGRLWKDGKFWLALALSSAVIVFPMPFLGHEVAQFFYSKVGLPAYYLKHLLWISLSFLMPMAWDDLIMGPAWRAKLAAAVAVSVGAIEIVVAHSLPIPINLQMELPLVTFAMLAMQIIMLLWMAWRPAGPRSSWIAVFLLLVPMAFPLSLNHLAWNKYRFADNDAVKWLRDTAPHERLVSPWIKQIAIPPNLGQIYGVHCSEACAVLLPNKFMKLYYQGRTSPSFIVFSQPVLEEAFRQLGARFTVSPQIDASCKMAGSVSVAGVTICPIAGTSGRLYFSSATKPLLEGETLGKQVLSLGNGSATVAVVEAMGAPTPLKWPGAPDAEAKCSFAKDDLQIVEITTRNLADGFLVLKDTWYPGWEARVDGTKVPIYRVNGCFRGVIVPAGEHKVVFEYKPTLIYVSGAISLIVTLTLLAIALWPRRLHGGHAKLA